MVFRCGNNDNIVYPLVNGKIFPLLALKNRVFSAGLSDDGIGFHFGEDAIDSPCFGVIMITWEKNGTQIVTNSDRFTADFLTGQGESDSHTVLFTVNKR